MHFFTLALLASTASALSFPDASIVTGLFARKNGDDGNTSGSGSGSGSGGGSGKCPAVWTSISKQLTAKFLSGGQCNPDARAAIRLIFHDCGGTQYLKSHMNP